MVISLDRLLVYLALLLLALSTIARRSPFSFSINL